MKLNLRRRGINCDDKCPVCNNHKESTLHAIWECPKLKYARRLWLPRSKLCMVHFPNAIDLFYFYSNLLSIDELGIFCVTIWKVWGIRNEWVHKGKKGEVCEAVWWSRNYVDELHRARCKLSTDSRKNEGDRWRTTRARKAEN
ncbi:hypothetical protein Ddye_027225 [Dipteronia dyeriana]|uniref:Reverse transcriptase zinc-binding domain-containing protein n=1 Tax=Dipteronia dyeriana TaxID=168575 RepID=A0AAD9TPM6_9ROSI|nr:hypothetical protein Ddye_027225 [Dipteronia dyeriana]